MQTMDIKFFTPTEMWESFSTSSDTLESSVTSQDETNNVVCVKQFFTGDTASDGPIRAYCEIYFDKRWTDERPAIMLIPPDQKFNFREVATSFVKEGYVTCLVDYCGNIYGDHQTSFPSSLAFAKWPESKSNLKSLPANAKESVFYVWSKIVRRALTLLSQQQVVDSEKIAIMGNATGAQIAWIIAGIDKRVKALIAINGGGYLWASELNHKEGGNVPQSDAASAFSSGIGAETYARMVSCPVLLIASSNSTYYNIDQADDILANVKSDNKTFLISQGSDSQITRKAFDVCKNWLRNNFIFNTYTPNNPSLKFENIGNKLYLRLNTKHKAKVREFYVSYGEPYSYARSWEKLTTMQKVDTHQYTCVVPVNDINDIVVAYATVTYDQDKVESTTLVQIDPKKFDIIPDVTFEDQTDRIFYDSTMGTGTFTAVTNSALLNEDTIKIKEGPFGIKGLASEDGSLYLRHNASDLKSITKSGLLHFDIYSPTARKLELTMYSYPERKAYYITTTLEGGEFWQNIILNCTDFKSEEGRQLLDFNTTKLFKINDVGGLLFNNFLWI